MATAPVGMPVKPSRQPPRGPRSSRCCRGRPSESPRRLCPLLISQELHETRRRVDAAAASWAADRAALIARAEDAEHALSEAQMRVMEIELGVVQAPANAPSTVRPGPVQPSLPSPRRRHSPARSLSSFLPQAAWEYGAQEEARERYRELEDDLGDAEAKVQARVRAGPCGRPHLTHAFLRCRAQRHRCRAVSDPLARLSRRSYPCRASSSSVRA